MTMIQYTIEFNGMMHDSVPYKFMTAVLQFPTAALCSFSCCICHFWKTLVPLPALADSQN